MHNGNLHFAKNFGLYQRAVDFSYEDEEKMQNGNLHFAKKFGLYQLAVDLYL